jgi:hypothetical protein
MNNSIDVSIWEGYKSSNKVFKVKSFKDLNLSWDIIIDLINEALHTPSASFTDANNNYTQDKYVYQNDVASILKTIGYVQFISKTPTISNTINELVNEIDNIFLPKNERTYIQFFCNLVSTNYVSEVHSDPWDAVVVQLKGSTTWDIYDENKNNILESISLEEGDLLLVPSGAIHKVTSSSSRVTLNFPIHPQKKILK